MTRAGATGPEMTKPRRQPGQRVENDMDTDTESKTSQLDVLNELRSIVACKRRAAKKYEVLRRERAEAADVYEHAANMLEAALEAEIGTEQEHDPPPPPRRSFVWLTADFPPTVDRDTGCSAWMIVYPPAPGDSDWTRAFYSLTDAGCWLNDAGTRVYPTHFAFVNPPEVSK